MYMSRDAGSVIMRKFNRKSAPIQGLPACFSALTIHLSLLPLNLTFAIYFDPKILHFRIHHLGIFSIYHQPVFTLHQ